MEAYEKNIKLKSWIYEKFKELPVQVEGLMSHRMTGVNIGTSPMREDSIAPSEQTKERLVTVTSVEF